MTKKMVGIEDRGFNAKCHNLVSRNDTLVYIK